MKRVLTFGAAGIVGAFVALLVLSLTPSVFARGPNAQPDQRMSNAAQNGRMRQDHMGGTADSLVGMAAAQLNLTQAELVAQLGTDGTILAALTEAGIAPEAFLDTFVASRAERLDAAVAAGWMTQEEAAAQLALARSMAATRIAQPLSANGRQSQAPGSGNGPAYTDADGDGVCDHQPAGGQGRMGGGRGPRP